MGTGPSGRGDPFTPRAILNGTEASNITANICRYVTLTIAYLSRRRMLPRFNVADGFLGRIVCTHAQVAGDDSLWEEYWSQPCVKGDQQTLREWLSWLPGPREKLISPGAVSQTDQYMSKNGLADWLTHTLREAFRKRYRDVVM